MLSVSVCVCVCVREGMLTQDTGSHRRVASPRLVSRQVCAGARGAHDVREAAVARDHRVLERVDDKQLRAEACEAAVPEDLSAAEVGLGGRTTKRRPARHASARNEAEDKADGERERTDDDAREPLVPRQGHAAEGEAAKLNNDRLDDHLSKEDEAEERVIEHSLEHVELAVNLARVDLVEHLHLHKRVEDDRVVLRGLGIRRVRLVQLATARHVEDLLPDKDEDEHDGQLVYRLAQHHQHHAAREERLVASVRLALQQRVRGRLRREGERRKRVHDEVDPQQLHGRQRRLLEHNRANERDDDGANVDGELELQELGDRVVHVAAPLDGRDDRVEVVVHEDDVGRVLGHRCARNAHRKADVRALEGRAVVRSVTRHGHDLAVGAEPAVDRARHERVLVLRRRPREHAEARENLVKLVLPDVAVLVQDPRAKLGALHDELVPVVEDATLARNRPRRRDVVARHHAHDNSRVLAQLDGPRHLGAHGVLNAHNAHEGEIRLGEVRVERAPVRRRRKVAEGERERAEAVVRERLDDAVQQAVLLLVAERAATAVRGHHVGAEGEHHFRRALGEEAVGAVRHVRDRTHPLARR
eukprot:Opistho-1_new@48532